MKKLKITVEDAKATLRDAATGPDSQNWRYSPAVKALLNNHDELLVILGEAKVALEEKNQRIAELEKNQRTKWDRCLDAEHTKMQALLSQAERRADSTEQREEHLKADAAVMGKRIAELEQRLQQPIKLRKCDIGIACEFISEHVVVSLAAVMVEAATAGFKVEVEGE
ncbi:hypothetical protein [Serratia sp. JSRIV004]|uniref:hypothetical protein n=1 Tax=Serratia sp. JSRIV004 TaxID=2831895 RepID=UPI001CC03E9B|nr:hypothetical protein [Serratia sp. JSRIV004]UAN59599.1 hypothetical protein KGP21_11345 [Serratia sp. JSRIV004]